MMLRAAVVGLGSMVYGELDDVELVAVCDTDPARVARATRGRTARGFTDVEVMLDETRPDLVSVAVPTGAHAQVALAAIERGVACLVEKPLAASVAEGAAIRDTARAAGVPLAVGHIERFNPAVVELKRRITAGDLGRVFQVSARRVGPFPSRIRDVGVVLDLATHDIDIMRYVLGSEVERVYAETHRRIHTEREDMLSAVLRFEDGVVGALDVNWLTPTKIRQLAVLGERGMFVVDYITEDLWFYENARAGERPAWPELATVAGVSEGLMERAAVEKREPLRLEIEAFLRCVRDGGPPPVSADDALAAMAVAEALIESARTGAPVRPTFVPAEPLP
jgi:predicted dehydrogenase